MSPAPTRGRAGGKVILLGEHAVVYGRPAVASGLPLALEAEAVRGTGPRLESDVPAGDRGERLVREACAAVGLDAPEWVVRVRSEIPAGQGLGSSAALCVAALRALAAAAARTLGREDELRIGRGLEGIFHGTPSGIDPTAAVLGTTVRFVRGDPPAVEGVALGAPVSLVVGLGGSARSTGAVVGGLRARWQGRPAHYEALFDQVAAAVEEGVRALRAGDVAALGAAFDSNQTLLEALGVSSPEIDARVGAARAAGALGAKLTGGGAGGAVLAVVETGTIDAVTAALHANGVVPLRITLVG